MTDNVDEGELEEFNPATAAKAIADKYKRGEVVPAAMVSDLIGIKPPDDNTRFVEGQKIVLERLNRIKKLEDALLFNYQIMIIHSKGALTLVLAEEQVDRARDRAMDKVNRVLRDGIERVANLEKAGLTNEQINYQHDVHAAMDALRRAIIPNSRRLKRQLPPEAFMPPRIVTPLPFKRKRMS